MSYGYHTHVESLLTYVAASKVTTEVGSSGEEEATKESKKVEQTLNVQPRNQQPAFAEMEETTPSNALTCNPKKAVHWDSTVVEAKNQSKANVVPLAPTQNAMPKETPPALTGGAMLKEAPRVQAHSSKKRLAKRKQNDNTEDDSSAYDTAEDDFANGEAKPEDDNSIDSDGWEEENSSILNNPVASKPSWKTHNALLTSSSHLRDKQGLPIVL